MIKNILVPIDYSTPSLNALETAVHIAMGSNAHLHLLHVNDKLPGTEETSQEEKANEQFNAAAGDILAKHGLKPKVLLTEGIVGHTIIEFALGHKIDLIIMGFYGLSGAKEPFIGSNASYVIKRASCPVLLIPEGKKFTEFEKILLPVRPAVFSYKVFAIIEEIIKRNRNPSHIQVLGISADRYERDMERLTSKVKEIKDKAKNNRIDISLNYSTNINIAEGVLSKASQSKADLIIISPGVDMAAKPFFVGPFSQRIINDAKVPVLSILKINVE